jgi:hypothetical protein
MTERSIFRLLAYTLGLYFVGMGLAGALAGLFTAAGIQSARYYSASDRAAAGTAYVITGVLLMVVTRTISQWLYGPDPDSD